MTQSSPHHDLRNAIEHKSATIGIIGLGYVGLPLAQSFHHAGFRVLGFDNDPEKIDALERGQSYLKHLHANVFSKLADSPNFSATTNLARLSHTDAVLICLPTPIGKHHEPDLTYVLRTAEHIGANLRAGQLIVLESTTYPGTTRDELAPVIAQHAMPDLELGRDYFIAYSPEREDPGSKTHTTATIPKLVGGLDQTATDLATALYKAAVEQVIPVASAETAEAAKILENVFRAVNIALVNEMKIILSAIGIDVWNVIEAASTKPFGFMPFYPGPGLGGHCIPVDPFYLAWKARESGIITRFIELAGEINRAMPARVVNTVAHALNDRAKPLRDANILVLGVAYKPNVDDVRETPAAEIIEELQQRGANVAYHDTHVPRFPKMRDHDIRLESTPLTPETLRSTDALVIVTDHDDTDWHTVASLAPLIVDTRNAIRRRVPNPPHPERLVFA